MTLSLRPAAAADVEAVSSLFLRCFRESYRELVPKEVADHWDDASARVYWSDHILHGLDDVSVAVEDDAVIGVVRFAQARDEPQDAAVHSLYVDPEQAGRGIGTTLLRHAEHALADRGVDRVRLWVFDANEPARKFYERNGWRIDGVVRRGDFGIEEIRMSRGV